MKREKKGGIKNGVCNHVVCILPNAEDFVPKRGGYSLRERCKIGEKPKEKEEKSSKQEKKGK